jgi:hypothetical protein
MFNKCNFFFLFFDFGLYHAFELTISYSFFSYSAGVANQFMHLSDLSIFILYHPLSDPREREREICEIMIFCY